MKIAGFDKARADLSPNKNAPSDDRFICYLSTASNNLRLFKLVIEQESILVVGPTSGKIKVKHLISEVHAREWTKKPMEQ